MGGRRSPQTKKLVGSGSNSSETINTIKNSLDKKESEIAAKAIVAALATTNPMIAAAYTAYKVAEFIYPIAEKGVEKYEKTHNEEKALDAMKKETIKQTGKEIAGYTVGCTTGMCLEKLNESGLKTSEPINAAISEAASETIKEVIHHE